MRAGHMPLAQPLIPPRALREHYDDLALLDELGRGPHRFDVALAPSHLEGAAGPQERRQHGVEELRLGHEAQLAARQERDPERPRVEVGRVVRREDEASLGKVFQPLNAKTIKPHHDRPADKTDEQVERRNHGTQSSHFQHSLR